jgi:multisubunit Na+/H+ antiporter MnhG subunit
MMRGEKTSRRRAASGDWFARIARRLTGQPSGRAAYSYVTKMAMRDWQFRRLALQGMFPIFFLLFQAVRFGNITGSPFEQQRLASAHFVPHLVGYILMTICVVMSYSDQYKSAWIFLTVPMAGIQSFVRGIYWSLWLPIVLTPHVVVLAIGIWLWGPVSALTFTAYSLAISSLYLSATLRLLDGLPFATAPKPRARVVGLPLVLAGMAICGLFVALQYYFLFRSLAITAAAALIAAVTAVALARNTLRGIETNVLHNLHILASGSSRMFQELDTESQES